MQSTEAYRVVREVVGPWCRVQGFRRTKSAFPGWYKPVTDRFLVFWFQCDKRGWDNFAGSKFTVEFQLGSEPGIGTMRVGENRKRLPQFLDNKELEKMREIQNNVILRLRRPPSNHPALHISPEISAVYLEKFKPDTKPYKSSDDIWLRYYTDRDVKRWAEFVLAQLPLIVARFEVDEDRQEKTDCL